MLETISLFSKVSPEALQRLEQLSTIRKYPKNTVLFIEGDDSSHLFIIKTGKVSVYSSSEDGRQVILNYLSEGECFGELSLVDGKPRSASVSTLTPCEMIVISRTSFQELMRTDHEFLLGVTEALAEHVRNLTDNVKDLALLDVYGRVSNVLEKLSNDNGIIQGLKLTHKDIAEMVGSSREMVSRIMKQLVIGEYIEQCNKHIRIKKTLPKAW